MIVTDAPLLVLDLLHQVQKHHPSAEPTFHVMPVPPVVEEGKKMNRAGAMEAKLCKTKFFQLLPNGVEIDRIFYLDCDILTIQPIQTSVVLSESDGKLPPNLMIKQTSEAEKLHSGIMLCSREAEGCFREWAEKITSGLFGRDQQAFANSTSCLDVAHAFAPVMHVPESENPKLPNGRNTTFIHCTNSVRAKLFVTEEFHEGHREFLEKIGGIPCVCLDLRVSSHSKEAARCTC